MNFIKLDRALLGWRYSHDPNYVALWVHLLLKANYKPSKFENVSLESGEFVTSIGNLARETGLSVQKVRTILKHLNGEELTYRSTNRFTVIKIVKWAKYQYTDEPSNKQINKRLTNKQQTNNNRRRNKEYKKERNIYNSLPVYDSSSNPVMDEDDEKKLMDLMKGQNDNSEFVKA